MRDALRRWWRRWVVDDDPMDDERLRWQHRSGQVPPPTNLGTVPAMSNEPTPQTPDPNAPQPQPDQPQPEPAPEVEVDVEQPDSQQTDDNA